MGHSPLKQTNAVGFIWTIYLGKKPGVSGGYAP